jgi:hypothetical protein
MRQTLGVQDAFGYVLVAVVVLAGIAATAAFVGAGKLYQQIGRGAFAIGDEEDLVRRPAPTSAAARREREDEIRQLLTARNEMRAHRGEPPLDVEAELARLTAPAVDPQLREEIRQLVVARNERRVRAGKEPLDVEAEVGRQVRELR